MTHRTPRKYYCGQLALVVLLTGCSTRATNRRQPQVVLPVPSGQCIRTAMIKDYRTSGQQEIRVRTATSGWQYRVILDRKCALLPVVRTIGWTSQQGRLCDYRHDAILVGGERCAIGRIEEYISAGSLDDTAEISPP